MRTILKWAALVLLPVMAVLLALPDPAHAATLALAFATNPEIQHPMSVIGLVGLAGVMQYRVVGVDYPTLFGAANVTDASKPETLPWILYDQQDFATSWTSVDFFGASRSDVTLGNIGQGNTIAGEQYFVIYAITADFQMGASSANNSSAATQLDDARIIMETARATLSLTLADKLVFRIPLAACHAIGGYQAWVAGSNFSGSGIFNSVQNYGSDGAWWCDGAIILPPKQTFNFNVRGVAATLTATRAIRLALHGVLYRPVR